MTPMPLWDLEVIESDSATGPEYVKGSGDGPKF